MMCLILGRIGRPCETHESRPVRTSLRGSGGLLDHDILHDGLDQPTRHPLHVAAGRYFTAVASGFPFSRT
jgi:hypothetical protein